LPPWDVSAIPAPFACIMRKPRRIAAQPNPEHLNSV